jgi:hypothetical protein
MIQTTTLKITQARTCGNSNGLAFAGCALWEVAEVAETACTTNSMDRGLDSSSNPLHWLSLRWSLCRRWRHENLGWLGRLEKWSRRKVLKARYLKTDKATFRWN